MAVSAPSWRGALARGHVMSKSTSKSKSPARKPAAPKPKTAPKKAAAPVAQPSGKVPGGPGVIATIIEVLRNGGGTVEEITDALAKKFPERDAKGMGTTVRIQVKRLPKSGKLKVASQEIEGRGLVYRATE